MAHGKLGSSNLAAEVNTTVYTAASTCLFSDVSIHLSNNNNADVTVSIAVTTNTTTIPAADWIENNITITRYGAYDLTNVKMSPGESVVVRSETANVTARVMGSEVTKL